MIDDWPLAIARFAQTLGGLSLVGAQTFAAMVVRSQGRAIIGGSFAVALAGAVAWVLLMAGQYGATPGALLLSTGFGRVLLIRIGLFAVATCLARPWPKLAAWLAWLGLATAALSSHAAAIGDWYGMMLLALHVLAAGVWLGGLLPLWRAGTAPARRFGNLAAVAVAVIVASAIGQGLVLIGDLPSLFGTGYGQAALVKCLLLLAMLAVALFNRTGAAGRLAWLRAGIAAEIALGLVVVAAATVMASFPPAAHSVPVWPFPWALSFDVLGEPELHDEVFAALEALLGAFALLLLAVLARRVRWLAVAAAAGIVFYTVPQFDLLLVPAVPTSFQHSPTGFAATGIASAAKLYPTQCAICHGVRGQGDGPEAAKQNIPPADLTAAHLWDHPDGALFWMIQSGSRTAVDTIGMPGLGNRLTRDQIWSVIDYIRARNAANAADGDGVFTMPVTVPALALECAGMPATDLASLIAEHGAILILRAKPVPGRIPTVFLSEGPPAPGTCVAADQTAWAGYAVLADTPSLPEGAWFTVDANGWLRQRGSGTPEAAWRKIRADPLTLPDHPHSH